MSSDGAFQPRRSFHDLQGAGARGRGRAQVKVQAQADTGAGPTAACVPGDALEERWSVAGPSPTSGPLTGAGPSIGAGRSFLSRDPGFLQQISRMISSRLPSSVASVAAAMIGDADAVGVGAPEAFEEGDATRSGSASTRTKLISSSSSSSSSSSLMQPLLGRDLLEETAPTAGPADATAANSASS